MKKLTTVLATAAVALAALALLNTAGNLTTAAPKNQPPEPTFLVVIPTLTEEIGGECNDGGVQGNFIRYVGIVMTAGWDRAHAHWIRVNASGDRSTILSGNPFSLQYRAVPGDPWENGNDFEVSGVEGRTEQVKCNSLETLELAVYLKK